MLSKFKSTAGIGLVAFYLLCVLLALPGTLISLQGKGGSLSMDAMFILSLPWGLLLLAVVMVTEAPVLGGSFFIVVWLLSVLLNVITLYLFGYVLHRIVKRFF